jgi:pimeloyl-ACP methyl ester carboxylesterase
MGLPALILIHGYPFDHFLWNFVAEPLRKITRVVAPDLPGFGGRPVAEGEPSIDVMADDVVRVMAKENINRGVIAGMSMGGYIALSIAERYPDRVLGLGLISTHCWADTDEMKKGRRQMIEKVKKEGVVAAVNAALPKLFAPANANREDLKKFPIEGAAKAGVDGICYALEAMARRPDRSSVVKNARFPLLVLHGVEDKFIPLERAREMAALNPKAEFVEMPSAGHGAPVEAADEVVRALENLLKRSE